MGQRYSLPSGKMYCPVTPTLVFSSGYDTLNLASPISILCGVRYVKWYSPQKFLARNNLKEQGPETAERSYTMFLLCHYSDSLGGISMAKKYEELTFNDDFMFCRILEEKPALCRELLELVLDHKVGNLSVLTPRSLLRSQQMGRVYVLAT